MAAYDAQLERIAVLVESLLLTAPPALPPAGIGDVLDYVKLAARLRGLTAADITALVKIFSMSAADYLDEWFESPEIKVTLATDGVIGANGGPRSPGTAYVLLHHCMGGVGGRRGLWGFVRGGMGTVTEAMAASARAAGAEIRCDAEVRGDHREGQPRHAAWCWRAARRLAATHVASNLDPKRDLRAAGRSVAAARRSSRHVSATTGSRARPRRSTWP